MNSIDIATETSTCPDSKVLSILSTTGSECPNQNVACDQAFYEAITTATSGVGALLDATERLAVCLQNSDSKTRSASSGSQVTLAAQRSSSSVEALQPVVLLANATRATSSGRERINQIEAQFNARVITVKLLSTLGEVDKESGKLIHICADFKSNDGMAKVLAMLAKYDVPTPWAIILDYNEPVTYGVK